MEIIDGTEQTAQQDISEAASLTLEQITEVPIKGETESGLPENIDEFNNQIKFEISKMHEQYKISIETEHENKLAKEIRDVYCQLSTIKRTQAVILAQSNGILASSALGLPICTRLQGFGQAMTLQQCETKWIFISAKESKCRCQPFFTYEDKNCLIGVDGWSIHPYSDCFWKTHLVNFNGLHHTWEHNSTDGEWLKQKANIHMPNLDLIMEFEELHSNDFDYSLKSHPAHETMEMEQLNILNDLVGLMQQSDLKSVYDIVMSEKQDNQIGEIIEQPFTRMTAPTPLTMERPSQLRPPQPSAPKQRSIYPIMEENWESEQACKCTGKHTTCTYVVGYGMDHSLVLDQLGQSHEALEKELNRWKRNARLVTDDMSVGLALLATGNLPPDLFPPTQLQTLLAEIRSSLVPGWDLTSASPEGDLRTPTRRRKGFQQLIGLPSNYGGSVFDGLDDGQDAEGES
ncbi:hypothetical protein OUZ56_011726 [Daphnia magna]|uniref:Uncharacterized protein n=1 Tax=Daphnia magna TaxID=35525 RepID=A0ABQ9Z0Z4_9CRUS|nr:hypothetical protein OUZ56_011726 [Daphnia magna]